MNLLCIRRGDLRSKWQQWKLQTRQTLEIGDHGVDNLPVGWFVLGGQLHLAELGFVHCMEVEAAR